MSPGLDPRRTDERPRCWVCGADHLEHFRESSVARESLGASSFRITDAEYGNTMELVRCRACGFIQLADQVDVTPFYERMDDAAYELTRSSRGLQARELLEGLSPGMHGTRLLDVGAGSGVLVEQATRLGWEAEGVEPSAWLADRARERGIAVQTGTLPHPGLTPPYDVVTLVDVIEHVTDPRGLLGEVRKLLRPAGWLLVVTPDVRSVAARALGPRWWHYRIAHVGYFSPSTLDTLLSGSGFVLEGWRRPAWYFSVGHFRTLAARLLPFLRWVPVPRAFARAPVRVNLFDSMAALYRAPAR
jgi:2-polyprenyl-3-methyl-5-hydroxy-6-metoxy-1,4-benzoquinol methylase